MLASVPSPAPLATVSGDVSNKSSVLTSAAAGSGLCQCVLGRMWPVAGQMNSGSRCPVLVSSPAELGEQEVSLLDSD